MVEEVVGSSVLANQNDEIASPNDRGAHFGAGNLQTETIVRSSSGLDKNGVKSITRTFKVIVIGDSNVGKTCLMCRACAGTFPVKVEATIGVDFKEKALKVGGEEVKLQIWDSAGQERFRYSLVPHYYRNVHAVIFVYDVTRKSSFDHVQKWLDEFRTHVDTSRQIPQLIIGNKCDLHASREVGTNEAKSFANHHGLPLWETSAKSDLEVETIETIFQSLAETLKLQVPLLEFPPYYSSIIQSHQRQGLSVNKSISVSGDSFSPKQSRRSKPASPRRTNTEKNCCVVL